MAGIHVSGGTYSGSGDVTIDWFKADNDPYYVWLPDGTMTITSESGSWCFYAIWPGSQDNWKHQNGTVKITTPAGTLFQGVPVNADSSGRVGQFYNIEVNQDAYGASKDPVTFGSATEGGHLKLGGNLTITSGTATTNSSPSNADYLYEIVGGLTIGASGAFNQGYSGDAGFPPGFQYNGYGDLKVGWIHGKDWNGGDGVQLVLSSGQTTINSTNASEQAFIFDDQRAGHIFHSSGTVRFEPGAGVTQKLRWSTDGRSIYNAVVSGGASSYVKGFMSGADYLTFTNDLTIDAGTMGPYGDKLRVTGNVVINDGTLDTHTTNGTTSPHAMGSLIIEADGTYNATAYQTNITGPNNAALGGYLWRSNAGTFNHNNGLVYFDTGSYNGADIYPASTQYFYDLTLSGTGTVEMYGCTIANDFDVGADVIFRPITPTQAFVVSGTATMNGFFGKDGYPQTTATDNTFGAIDIPAGGTYYATSGTTKLYGKTGVTYTQTGTFTHNDGLFWVSGGSQQMKWGDTLHGPFYDLKSSGVGNEMRGKALKIENSFIITDGYVVPSYNGGTGKVWTLGTASSSAYISGTASDPLWVHDSNPPYHFVIQASSSLFPAELKGYEWKWSGYGTAQSIKFSDVNCEFDISTDNGGTVANQFEIIDQCNFQAVTVEENSRFNFSDQRVQFGGLLDLNEGGILSGANSLMVLNAGADLDCGSGGQIYGSGGSVILDGTPAGVIDLHDGGSDSWHFDNYVVTSGDIINNGTLNSHGPDPYPNIIAAGGSWTQNINVMTLNKLMIANGGTYTATTKAVTSGSFSNRGGLFASSSAFDFDGSSGLINAGAGSSIDDIFDGGGTIEGWVNLDSGGGANVGRLVSKDAYFIYFREDSFNNIRLQYTFNGGGAEWYTENDSFTFDSKWHHVAVTYDNSDIANDPSIYLDGKLLPLGTIVRPTGTRASDVGDVLYVGNNPTDIRALEGRLGMLRIFSDIRTAAEIRTDMFNQNSDMVEKTDLELMYQFDEGQGTTVTDVSTNSNTGTITLGTSDWATAGTWTAGGTLGAVSGYPSVGNLYIGNGGTAATVFASSYFNIDNYKLISGSKFASKSHQGTDFYYVATSGASDYMNYSALAGAPILTPNDLHILANSYFNFDTSANNNQCDEITNYAGSTVRIVSNADFYTQDFDNQGTWLRNVTYDGIIHDDGSTPHEYEPIDIMDDQDSPFDAEDLID